MTPAIHGAPAEALRRTLKAMAQLSSWISGPPTPTRAFAHSHS